MKCVKCGKNDATVYYKQNINGKITESALCEECAKKLKIEYENKFGKQISNIFDSVYDGFFGDFDDMNLLGGIMGLNTGARIAAAKKCKLCGSTLRDITESGKAGCSECYRTFRDELGASIERIHGRIKHNGRAPKKYKARLDLEQKIADLRQQLNKAVETQNFEDAAKLRDEIKSIEAKKSEQ